MAIELRVQLDSATALLAALGLRLDSSDELLAPALPVVAAAIERNFDEEGRPTRWAPLSARYAAWKARRFGAGLRILERSGALRRSISTRLEGGALVASTAVPYAAFHQFGTRFIPARPFLVLTESDNEEVAQAVADSLGTAYRVPGTSP
jgi:phage virion morphogenesis protein